MSVIPHPTKGPGFWRIRYQPEGRKGGDKYLTVQGTKDEALAIEEELRRQNRQHRVTAFPTLTQAAPDFLAAYAAEHQKSGTERTRYSLQVLLKFFGKYLFTSITPDLISRYKQWRLEEGVTHSTINKELAALSSFCRWAAEMRYCQPMTIKRFPPKLTRAPYPDVPSRIEMLAIINSMEWPKCGLFACMYLAGLRSSEARNMRVEDVHLDRRVLFVVGKGNKQGVVPIVKALQPVLEKRLAEVSDGFLWTKPDGTPYSDLRASLEWARKRAGVTRHIHPHLFRHAYGLHAVEAHIPIKHLQQAMRHSSTATTELYSRLRAASLVAEFDRFPTDP